MKIERKFFIENKQKLLLIIFVVSLFVWGGIQLLNAEQENIPSEGVLAATIKSTVWQPTYTTAGSFSSVKGIVLASQVTGKITAIAFHSGDKVKAGQLIIKLDPDYAAAQLQQKQSAAVLAAANYERYNRLLKKGVISAAEYDQVTANYSEANAQVQQATAQLSYQTIVAPFDGIIGLSDISVGELLQPGTPIASLQQLDSIYLDFSLPQRFISSNLAGQTITAKVELANQIKNFQGKIVSLDSQLDINSRSIMVRAQFNNIGHELMPGMYAEVYIPTGPEQLVFTVPATAVLNSLYGTYIFKLVKQHHAYQVAQIPVNIMGPLNEDLIITGDLKANESIVKMGAFKLTDKEWVSIVN
jgi:membrane fusion protein, multidrug efflux system